MPVSLDAFTRQLVASNLIPQSEIEAILAATDPVQRPQDGEQLARLLIERDRMTPFQVQHILADDGHSLVLGNYVILDKLGQGGLGIVLKASHRRMKRTVALKILSPSVMKRPEAARRFQREVEAAAKLEHPNIVTAYDADEADETRFLVMQFVDGVDLAALVKAKGPLSIRNAAKCLVQVATGLAYAHSRGVVHRDIKPSNLLLDRQGTVKILDMGLARFESAGLLQDDLTETGQIMGTVDYMAPEQAMDTKSADARADIYSLGITLWFLLTGRCVYTGDSAIKKLMAHQHDPIPSLQQARPDAPAALDVIFQTMVAKTPDQRYQSMNEAIAALQGFQQSYESRGGLRCSDADVSLPDFLDGLQPQNVDRLEETMKSTAERGTAPLSKEPTVSIRHTLSIEPDQVATGRGDGDSVKPPSLSQSRPSSWGTSVIRLAAACGGFLILLAVAIFLIRSGDGSIRIEIDDPEIEVMIKGTNITLKSADDGKDIKVSAGDHTLIVHRGDLQFETNKFVLKKGDRAHVKVEYLAGEITVHEGETLLGRKKWTSEPMLAGKTIPAAAIAPYDPVQAKGFQDAWATYLALPVEFEDEFGVTFRLIPPGEFEMGSPPSEINAIEAEAAEFWVKNGFIKDQGPSRHIRLTRPYYLAKQELTNGQFRKFVAATGAAWEGLNPEYQRRHYGAAGEPPDAEWAGLSWNMARDCLQWMTEKTHERYRFPTEAEWEFACRAGSTTRYLDGPGPAGGRLRPAGPINKNSELTVNPFGLMRLKGHAWDWCQDFAGRYGGLLTIDPVQTAPNEFGFHVLRGGSYNMTAEFPAAWRFWDAPVAADPMNALRPVREISAKVLPREMSAKGTIAEPQPAVAPFNSDEAHRLQSDWAKFLGVPAEFTNRVGMKFVLIPPGEFEMGSTANQVQASVKTANDAKRWQERIQSEAPKHRVVLTIPFYLGVTEVTQNQYRAVMGTNPSHFAKSGAFATKVTGGDTGTHPVEMIDWNDAVEFCAKLSVLEGEQPFYSREGILVRQLPGSGYRLPTEAEWEFSARAGTTSDFDDGNREDDLARIGWYGANAGGRTYPAAQLKKNPFGLFDMHGNVWEWVQDGWDPLYYSRFENITATNPDGPTAKSGLRVLRGGSWSDSPSQCRAASRSAHDPTYADDFFGFRVTLTVDAVKRTTQARETGK